MRYYWRCQDVCLRIVRYPGQYCPEHEAKRAADTLIKKIKQKLLRSTNLSQTSSK